MVIIKEFIRPLNGFKYRSLAMIKYESGKIMPEEKPPDSRTIPDRQQSQICCLHKNVVPLEVGFAVKSWPNGYKNEPNYNFAVGILNSNVIRVRMYLCLDCKQEIKAPNPGQLKKDRL